MVRSLKDFVMDAKKSYKYRLKFAYPLEETHFEQMEIILEQFTLKNVSNITRTPVQMNPLDFPTINASEVYIFDIETDSPFSDYAVRFKISTKTGIPEKCIVIRSENSPYNKYEQDIIDYQTKTYVPKLFDPMYVSDGTGEKIEDTQDMIDDIVKDIKDEHGRDFEPVSVSSFKKAIEVFTNTGSFKAKK